jgi:hypothetical protein
MSDDPGHRCVAFDGRPTAIEALTVEDGAVPIEVSVLAHGVLAGRALHIDEFGH